MPCLPKLAAALALAAVAAWLVRNRPEQDPETYPVQPVDPWLQKRGLNPWLDLVRPAENTVVPSTNWHSTN